MGQVGDFDKVTFLAWTVATNIILCPKGIIVSLIPLVTSLQASREVFNQGGESPLQNMLTSVMIETMIHYG